MPAGQVTRNYSDRTCSRSCGNPELSDANFMSVLNDKHGVGSEALL